MLLCPTRGLLESCIHTVNERNEKLHSVQYLMINLSLSPQTPPALASTHWEASLLLTWPKTQMGLRLDRKVGFNFNINYALFNCLSVSLLIDYKQNYISLRPYCSLFYEDSNFSWANAGATVFGSAVTSAPKNNGDEEGSDEEEASNNVDIHFEPIVSLPEVPF